MSPNSQAGRHLRCEICSFTFHRSDHLKRHLLIRKRACKMYQGLTDRLR